MMFVSSPSRRLGGVLLAGWLLTGCTLIDQRTFRAPPPPAKPVVAPPPAAPAGPPPLVVIRPSPELDLATALRGPVASARARKQDVVFEIASVVPPGTPDAVKAGLASLDPTARQVAQTLSGLGVPRLQIRLGVRLEAVAQPEIHLYIH
jgi:hypothetical protein